MESQFRAYVPTIDQSPVYHGKDLDVQQGHDNGQEYLKDEQDIYEEETRVSAVENDLLQDEEEAVYRADTNLFIPHVTDREPIQTPAAVSTSIRRSTRPSRPSRRLLESIGE